MTMPILFDKNSKCINPLTLAQSEMDNDQEKTTFYMSFLYQCSIAQLNKEALVHFVVKVLRSYLSKIQLNQKYQRRPFSAFFKKQASFYIFALFVVFINTSSFVHYFSNLSL